MIPELCPFCKEPAEFRPVGDELEMDCRKLPHRSYVHRNGCNDGVSEPETSSRRHPRVDAATGQAPCGDSPRHAEVAVHARVLCIAYYNFCKIHSSLRVTPAMEAGISDHVWSVRELLEAA